MTAIRKSALVPYSAQEMYALVADIESYGAFLPWCGGARILSRGEDVVTAAVDIDYSGIRKSFTTSNRMVPNASIDMHLLDGPFSRLEGAWRFVPLGERESKIALDLEFEFASRLLAFAMNSAFSRIADTMVDSFLQRAVQVYGKR